MTSSKRHIAVLLGLMLGVLACDGAPSTVEAELLAPDEGAREAQLELTPALDFSDVFDTSLGERIVLDEIIINVSDVRLLGLDPRLPTGGLSLVSEDRLIVSGGSSETTASYPFPGSLVDDDLAVYVRISQSPELDGSSVVVRGRLFAQSEERSYLAQRLVSGEEEPEDETGDGALDPDGEPAAPTGEGALDPDGEPAAPTGEGALDPDGEPAAPTGEGNVDPDGEPAHCEDDQRCFALVAEAEAPNPSVAFELRGDHTVELQVFFHRSKSLDVVLGVPAARWLTPESIAKLEATFIRPGSGPGDQTTSAKMEDVAVVIEDSQRMEQVSRASTRSTNDGRIDDQRSDYSLTSREDLEQGSFRGR